MNNTNGVRNVEKSGGEMQSGFFPSVFYIVDDLMDRHTLLDIEPRFVEVFRAQVEARVLQAHPEELELAAA